nr:bacteriohemerythrin [Halomicroarcula sp. SHR3]
MPLIEWDERRYSTGIDRYDNQHKRLFEVLNQLHDAMEEGHAEEELGDVLRELERYTEYHFTDEEEFMEGCGFADDCSECFFGHQEMHEEFAQKVTELRKKHEEGSTSRWRYWSSPATGSTPTSLAGSKTRVTASISPPRSTTTTSLRTT